MSIKNQYTMCSAHATLRTDAHSTSLRRRYNINRYYTLGIDIGSTTVKIAILDENNDILFSDYERHFANIQETLSDLLGRAIYKLGPIYVSPVITGSGGLTLAKHLQVPFVEEVIAVATAITSCTNGT